MSGETKQAESKIWYRLFGVAVILYAAMVIPPLIVNLLVETNWWAIDFYNTFAHILWLPAFGVLVISLLWQRWQLAGLMLVPVLAFALTFGPRYARYVSDDNTVAASDNQSHTLDVMTHNIQWRNNNYQNLVRNIRQRDADVVALQELTLAVADIFEAELSDSYPHMALHPQEWAGNRGPGLLSRYPIAESTFWHDGGVYGAQRAIVEVAVDDRSVAVIFYNVHPHHPGADENFFDPDERAKGITSILARTASDASTHRVLLGDFNMPELSKDYDRIKDDGWRDTYLLAGKGMGLTFRPSVLAGVAMPLLRIDYIFVDSGLQVRDVWVVQDTGGSDHRPVQARLHINAGD